MSVGVSTPHPPRRVRAPRHGGARRRRARRSLAGSSRFPGCWRASGQTTGAHAERLRGPDLNVPLLRVSAARTIATAMVWNTKPNDSNHSTPVDPVAATSPSCASFAGLARWCGHQRRFAEGVDEASRSCWGGEGGGGGGGGRAKTACTKPAGGARVREGGAAGGWMGCAAARLTRCRARSLPPGSNPLR